MREIEGAIPDHLREWWEPNMCCLHSAKWWQTHWERSGLVSVKIADEMPEGWRAWIEWQRAVCPDNSVEIAALEADAGRYLGYVRAIGQRKAGVKLDAPIPSIPPEYTRGRLLRDQ